MKIPFKRDTGIFKVMPYIEMREFKKGVGISETVCNNFEKFTKEEVKRAKLSR